MVAFHWMSTYNKAYLISWKHVFTRLKCFGKDTFIITHPPVEHMAAVTSVRRHDSVPSTLIWPVYPLDELHVLTMRFSQPSTMRFDRVWSLSVDSDSTTLTFLGIKVKQVAGGHRSI